MRRKTKNILYALLFVFGGVVYAMVGQPGDQPGLLDDTRVWASDCGPVLRAFREDPAHTAEMLPTWPAVGRYIASRVPRDARTILEVGTANGSVSRQLFQALLDNPVSEQTIEYDGVEISRLLFDDLERAHGHRKGAGVRFHHSPIEQWDKPDHIEQYDVIVSTLPKTQLPQPVLAEIYETFDRLLKPGGIFISVMMIKAHEVTRARKQAARLRTLAWSGLSRTWRRTGGKAWNCLMGDGEWVSEQDLDEALTAAEKALPDYEELAAFIDRWEGEHFEPIEQEWFANPPHPLHVFVQQKRGRALSERSSSGGSLGLDSPGSRPVDSD